MCDKLYVTKEFLNSHIQNNHTSLKYPNREMFKCRICGKELSNRKLLDNHIVVKHWNEERKINIKSILPGGLIARTLVNTVNVFAIVDVNKKTIWISQKGFNR